MARYKVLQSVAHCLGHAFASTLNYTQYDYVMGHLLASARASGEDTFTVDLMTGDAGLPALLSPPIAHVPRRYADRLASLVARHGSEMRYVHAATLTVRFDLGRQRASISSPAFIQNPYVCEVVVTDDRGKEYVARQEGWWCPEPLGTTAA